MAFCTNCGTELQNGATFCTNCGTPAAGVQPNVVQPMVFVKPKIPGRGFGISSMVLGIIGLVYSFVFTTSIIESIEAMYDNDVFIEASLVPILMFSVLSILSVCFAPAAISRGYKNGISLSGLILGIIGLIGYVFTVITILGYI